MEVRFFFGCKLFGVEYHDSFRTFICYEAITFFCYDFVTKCNFETEPVSLSFILINTYNSSIFRKYLVSGLLSYCKWKDYKLDQWNPEITL